jgi:hypothetical protein
VRFHKGTALLFCLPQNFADRFSLNLFDSFLHLESVPRTTMRAPASLTTLMRAGITPSSIAHQHNEVLVDCLGFSVVHAIGCSIHAPIRHEALH